jgi:aspartate/methionine/tyrosine aminotransferase
MSTLSVRGQQLVDTPPLAPYIGEHFARAERLWDPDLRPGGYIPLCIAENTAGADVLARRLDAVGPCPARALGYDAMIGNFEFRRHLAAFMERTFLGRAIAPEHLAVVAGAGSALELLFYAIADPGDGVLVPTPSYAGFWADLETRDALRIVTVDCPSEGGFPLTVAALDAALDGAPCPVKALLFTTPNNPLGRVYTKAELDEVLAWAERRNLHVVFDEVYALSVFGETPFCSAASLRPTLGERAHVVWAFSKDFGASGLRCGVLITENRTVMQAVDQLAYWAACSGHTQHLLSCFVAEREAVDGFMAGMRAGLRSAYARVVARLHAHGIEHLPAQAGFFVICDLRRYLDAPTPEAEDRLWRRLLDRADVNLTPGAACRIAEPGFFRLCYASVPAAAVEIGIDRVAAVLGELP